MSGRLVTIDPGHGGRDPGAVGPTNLFEKDVVLLVALRIRELLRVRGHAECHLTRETDLFVPLRQRLSAADAACYISIHCNAHTTMSANGTETFYLVGGHPEGKRLADVLQKHLIKRLQRRNRGVKTTLRFRVLRQAKCPAALVELAFISNQAEEVLLGSAEGQERAAQAIAAAVAEFIGVRLQPQPAPQTPAGRRTHIVRAGDTLWSLSRQYDVTVEQLQTWNNLRSTVIRVGQKLFVGLPGK